MVMPLRKLSYRRYFGMWLCIKTYLALWKVFNPLPTGLRILWRGICTKMLFPLTILRYTHYSHIADLFKIDTNSFNSNQFNVSQIRDTTIILDRVNNWNVLLFKEALMIKRHRATLNCGLMASKELQLFWLNFNDFFQHPIYSFNNKLIIPFLTL